ncbi:FAS1 domain-containing protein SELMODRAFT_448915-like [Apium graveolens]|uniref:FAS1 domain-containing protein SELMODRAFT_448915-like n=1 Tax=Apium graveolens TaxID=4045 RepID=UPI003D7A7F52
MANNLSLQLLCASILSSTLALSLAAFNNYETPFDLYGIPFPPPTSELDYYGDMIEALLMEPARSGDYFSIWCKLLAGFTTGPVLPVNATLFVPSNPAVLHLRHVEPAEFDKDLMSYHIIPQRLSFEDLLTLNLGTRLPTLLPSKSIIITSNSFDNFTVDDSRITHPNIYVSPKFAMHGIESTFNYGVYGEDIHESS